MSLRDNLRKTALEAREAAQAEARRHKEKRDEAERQEREAQYARAEHTIELSPLSEWFPGEEWSHMSYSSYGAATDYSDGRSVVVSPLDRSIYLLLERGPTPPSRPITVYAVELCHDTSSGYNYWYGREVKSPAEIGDWILARETAKARQ